MMLRLILLSLLVSNFSFGQDLKLIKATKQITNSGASPMSTINYSILVNKSKKCKLSIDSVVNVYTQKSSAFTITQPGTGTVLSPSVLIDAKNVTVKGKYEIHFYSQKSRGSGRPGAPPMNLQVPIADFTQGAVVYYRVGKKQKKLTIDFFEELETINAP